ncbi:hypothetical protein SAMN05720764_11623 [Fibrobacter sp. UWH5]|uniref:efflux RND transporter permease subunit n=1 Tax=Fibrobacter sp. UWH5 TaxID=1896211 RepID=UPI00091B455C|nr:MMPL family transporter [Fibrobacter sp. UWH5]SHL54201.1 hypothetical protein SAMN05720764_11623 [Fibrobacter sp. UWH5]
MNKHKLNLRAINERYATFANFLLGHRLMFIIATLLLVALALVGTKKIYYETSWDSYFVENDPMLQQTDKFKELFGNDYFVTVLTETDNIYTPENLKLLRELSEELRDSISYSDGKVTSLTNVEYMLGTDEGMEITQIVPEEIPQNEEGMNQIKERVKAKSELSKKLVTEDGKQTWILLKLRPFPDDSVWKAEGKIAPDMQTGEETDHIIEKEKYAPLHPYAGGMPYMSKQKINFTNKEMGRIMGITLLCAIFVMVVVTRSLRGVVAPILTTFVGILLTFGLAGFTGMYMDTTTSMIPPILSFAVSIAYNIHLYSFFRKEMLLHGKRRTAILNAVKETGWSITFSGLTTIVALFSFLAVMLKPIRAVGSLSALCVLFILAVALVISPIMLSFGKDKKPSPKVLEKGDTGLGLKMEALGKFVDAHSKAILAVFAALALVSVVGMFRVEPTFDVERTMGRKVTYVDRILHMAETKLGAIYSYEIAIEFPNNDDAKSVENLSKLDSLTSIVKEFKLTKRVTSILDIIKDLNRTLNENKQEQYTLPATEEEVAQMLLLYENAGGSESNYWIDYDYKNLRMMVEINTYNSNELEYELKDITEKASNLFSNAKVSAVGNVSQFTTMQQYLVRGQLISFGISVLIVAVLLMIVFGSVRTGLIGMIPNISPAIFVGGYLGWRGVPLDMMTATVIPMIIGLAVDDTIHFINHGKLEFERTGKYTESISRVFKTTGPALVMTTVIMCVTFASFNTSCCTMFFNFGFTIVVGLASALAADLFVTPILIKKFKIYGKEE